MMSKGCMCVCQIYARVLCVCRDRIEGDLQILTESIDFVEHKVDVLLCNGL